MEKIISILSAVSVFMSCIAITPKASAENTVISGWLRTAENTGSCYAEVVREDGNIKPASGEKMLKLAHGKNENIRIYIPDKLKSGTYTVKFKAYIDYSKHYHWLATAKLGYHSLSGNDSHNGSVANITQVNTTDTTSAMWREYTAVYTITSDTDGTDNGIGTNNLNFGFRNTAENAAVYYVDDVSITDADGNEYVTNGGFEEAPPYPTNEQRAKVTELENNLAEIKSLISQCAYMGISTDYEQINCSVMERFIKRLNDDMYDSTYVHQIADTHAEYVINSLDKLYGEAKENLTAYLSGSKRPKSVPHYVTSKTDANNKSFVADTVQNGIKSRRPVIFSGYGHFEEAKNEIPNFKNFGVNVIQQEIGPNQVFVLPTSENPAEEGKDYAISSSKVSYITDMLKNAGENNIAVNLLLSPHQFPQFYSSVYPEMYSKNFNISYNIWHEKAKQIVEDYLNYIVPIVKDYTSLNSICLSNEPSFDVLKFREFYTPYFRKYLKEIYKGDINVLNGNYSSSYSSFDEVDMPQSMINTPQGYDCAMFNSRVFGEWHKWMADIVHSIAPDIPVHCKMMAYYGSSAWNTTADGTVYGGQNLSESSAFSQFNGCDSQSYYSTPERIKSVQAWYDLMTSVKNAPVVNSEEHLVPDGSMDFSAEQAAYAAANIWQGAIHGRWQSVIWTWSGVYRKIGKEYLEMSIGVRPDIIAEIGKTNLDMNRLSYEIQAFGNKQADVIILQSDASSLYNYYRELRSKAYNASYSTLLEKGIKADFATDDTTDKIDASKYKVLIVPALRYVKDSTFQKISDYLEDGGKVVVIGEASLKCNEYGKVRDVSPVMDNASVITASELQNGDMSKLITAVQTAGLGNINVIDTAAGTAAKDIGFETAEYNGNRLINICNYSNAAKTVRIEVNSDPAEVWTELRSGRKTRGDIVLNPYEPVLLKETDDIKLSRVTFDGSFSSDGTGAVIAEDNLQNLVSGNIMAEFKAVPGNNCPKSKVTLEVALYKNDRLAKVNVETFDLSDGTAKTLRSVLNVSDDVDDRYKLKAFLWTEDCMFPIADCKDLEPKPTIYESNGKTVINGTFSDKSGQRVTLICVRENAIIGTENLCALDETLIDENGAYSFEFPLSSGKYDITVKCGGEKRKYCYIKD